MAENIRRFVLDSWTAQIKSGDISLEPQPIIDRILEDPALTMLAVDYAVRAMRRIDAGRLIRRFQIDGLKSRGSADARLVDALVDYGLSLLDVEFGGKRLGDYLPAEAIEYAGRQHQSARQVGIRARFVATVAKACPDAGKPIRDQIADDRVEAIRRFVVESSANKEAAESALAVA